MAVTISPDDAHATNSVQALRFGEACSRVETRAIGGAADKHAPVAHGRCLPFEPTARRTLQQDAARLTGSEGEGVEWAVGHINEWRAELELDELAGRRQRR